MSRRSCPQVTHGKRGRAKFLKPHSEYRMLCCTAQLRLESDSSLSQSRGTEFDSVLLPFSELNFPSLKHSPANKNRQIGVQQHALASAYVRQRAEMVAELMHAVAVSQLQNPETFHALPLFLSPFPSLRLSRKPHFSSSPRWDSSADSTLFGVSYSASCCPVSLRIRQRIVL
jgi:hypothetical protein